MSSQALASKRTLQSYETPKRLPHDSLLTSVTAPSLRKVAAVLCTWASSGWGSGQGSAQSGGTKRYLRPQRRNPMLVLSRKVGERVVIGDRIVVTVLEVKGRQVRLGFEAPPDVQIWRGELSFQDHTKTVENNELAGAR